MSYSLIMFDLDGTINDSGPGIMESVQYALDHFGLKEQPQEMLRKFVGPSLMDSFTRLYHFSEEDAEKAVTLYRDVYQKENMFHLTVYPGIVDVLKALHENPTKRVVLVTSKPFKFAEAILKHYDLFQYIEFISGPDFSDSSSDKSRLIDRAISKAGMKKDDALMIGDTHFDIDGAVKSGVDSIGVTYGYGSREELQTSGATYLVDNALNIMKYV